MRGNRLLLACRGRGARLAAGTRRVLIRRVHRAMRAAGLRDVELGISLSDDRELRALNRAYAGIDHATDVLSFAQREAAGGVPAPRAPGPGRFPRHGLALRAQGRPGRFPRHGPALRAQGRPGREPLGDVVISVEYARRQAAAAGRALPGELFHLAVHGLVHLLGYDHRDADEERVMFGYERALRAAALAGGSPRRISAPSRGRARS